MITRPRSGWERRVPVSPNKLLLALMIVISMFLLAGGPTDLAPSTQDQNFFEFVKEQYLDFSSGRSSLTGAAIGLPVQGCYNQTICVNSTVENCTTECNDICTNTTIEKCGKDCSSTCKNETINGVIREVCTGTCPIVCVNETKTDCTKECNPLCVNSTVEECVVEEVCSATQTTTTTPPQPTTSQPTTPSTPPQKTTTQPATQTQNVQIGESGIGLLEAPVITEVIINTSAGGNATAENITVFYTNNNTSAKNITDWKLNGTSITILNMPFEKVNDPVINATKDYSGNDNNGSEVGVTWNATGGYDGFGTYDFDGSASYIDLGDTAYISNEEDYSISTWIKAGTNTNAGSIYTEQDGTNTVNLNLFLEQNDKVIRFQIYDGAWKIENGTTPLNDNQWHHIALTQNNGTGLKVYVDGVAEIDNSTFSHATSGSQEPRIGTRLAGGSPGLFFNGNIDDFIIFNRTLSEDQILALYNNKTDLISSDETSVDDLWSACITPNDGVEDGATNCSSNLTVLAQGLPRASNVVINTSGGNNYTSENITLSWDITDPEDNDTKNITNWKLNGSSITVLNMPFEKITDSVFNATKDYSGNDNNGSETNGVTWNATGGYDGKGAFEFDGSDDLITIPDADSLNISNQMSLSFWIKPVQVASAKNLLGKYNSSGDERSYAITLADSADEITAWFPATGAGFDRITTDSANLQAGNWYHVVATFPGDLDFASIYINGIDQTVTVTGSSTSIVTNDEPFTIGSITCGGGSPCANFEGTIDEVQIFNHSLTPEQILNLYNNRTDLIDTNETSVDDQWSACVTPNDGTEDGAEVCSENLTIIEAANNAPVASNLVMNTSGGNNYTSENITLYWDITDDDNDDVKNITDWKLNGTSITVLNMPFEKVSDSVINATKDYSGNDNNGSEAAGVLFNATGGYDGKGAFEFDGVDDYIDLSAHVSEYANLASGSISGWFKTNYDGLSTIFSISDANDASSEFALRAPDNVGDGSFYVLVREAGSFILHGETDNNYNDGAWHHFVYTTDSSGNKVYIDGQEAAMTYSDGTSAATQAFFADVTGLDTMGLGRNVDSTGSEWEYKGTLDDFQIWNRSLTADQILALYENKTDTIVFQETRGGENWTGCITPNDGTEDGTEVCSDLILNNLEVTNVNVSSANNYTTENITVNYTLQNGSTQGITNWYKDGTSITLLNLPFEKVNDPVINATKDYSSLGNNGNEATGVTWNATGGVGGSGAYEFDGTGYIDFGDDGDFEFGTKDFAISAWIKANGSHDAGASTQGVIISKYNSGGNNREWDIRINGGEFYFLTSSGGDSGTTTNLISSGLDLDDNQWHHVVAIQKNLWKYIYVDGVLEGSVLGTGTVQGKTASMYIGAYAGSGTSPDRQFNGTIDQVMIFNRSLSAEQIKVLFENKTDYLASEEHFGGENWSACVTPNDGTEEGTEVCSGDIILNNLEVINVNVTSSSATNTTTENLTANYNLQNGSTRGIIDWRLNGTGFTLLNMPFEETNDLTINATKDYSIFSASGTEGGDVWWNRSGGTNRSGAYEFDGVDDYVTAGSTSLVCNSSEHSISAWVKIDDSSNGYIYSEQSTTNNVNFLYFVTTDGALRYQVYDGAWIVTEADQSIEDGQWHHVVVVHSSVDGTKLYVDGQLNVTNTTATNSPSALCQNPVIGAGHTGGSATPNVGHFNGTIDDFLIFNHSLSADQINALYENRTDLLSSDETSINDNWSFCVTPNDGTEDGAEVCSENLTIIEAASNNAPNTTSVIFNATDHPNNYTTADLTCWANITDADADTVYANYTIYHNDTINITGQSDAFTENTLFNIVNISSVNTTKDDNWTCEVVAYDGTDYETDWNNITITIENTPPEQGTPTINTTEGNNYTSENITVYNVSTADNDSDSIKNIFNWKLNGTSITVLNMPFEDNNNTNSGTKDYSGYEKSGTNNGATWNATGGYDGKGAYEFDGSNGIEVKEGINETFGSKTITVNLWVKPDSLSDWDLVIGQNDTSSNNGIGLGLSGPTEQGNDDVYVAVKNGGNLLGSSTGNILATGEWHMWTLIYNGDGSTNADKLKFYFDGVEKTLDYSGTIASSATSNYYPVLIGKHATDDTYSFDGTIDEVQIFNRTLTPEQILNIYNNRTDLLSFNETSVDDNWSACVTPNDGTEDGNEVCSENLTVLQANTAPNTISVTLNATDNPNNQTTANLTCYANITDADADTVYANYTWYLNETANITGQSAAFTQNTIGLVHSLDFANTTKDENWTCEVVAYDGTDYEADYTNSTQLVIQNTPPTQGTPTINTTNGNNYTSENITVYNVSTNDNDSDSIKNIFDWKLNGTSIALLNMPFEDNNNTNSGTKDYSQFGNDATNNGATWNATGGYDGKGAYEFNRSNNEYINLSNPSEITTKGSESFSIFAWIKTSDTGVRKQIAHFGNANTNQGEWFFINTDNKVATDLSNTAGTTSAVTVTDGLWHHVGVTNNNGVFQIYVDGYASGNSKSMSPNIQSGNAFIGHPDNWQFEGTIDEVFIFNHSLTTNQILNLYNNRTDLLSFNETSVDDNWSACVTPNDGTEDGSEVCSDTLTVLQTNTAPNTVLVTLNATDNPNNRTNANLTCYANITDADADTVYANYTWYLNDTINLTGQSPAFTESTLTLIHTLDSANTTKDDNWICEVTAYDGEDYEADYTNSTTITIQNSPPDQATPITNTTNGNNYTSENITVYNVSTNDNDSEPVKNIFDWRLNGTSIATVNMPFEKNASGTNTKDYSQFGNDATVSGATWNATGGFDGKGAYQFDGSSDNIQISDSSSIDFTEELTITAWVNPQSYKAWDRIVAKHWVTDADPHTVYSLILSDDNDGLEGSIFVVTIGGVDYAVQAVNSVPLNTWTHLVGTYDGNQISIYVNGVLANNVTQTGTLNTNDAPIFIGKSPWHTVSSFHGTIDEVKILNKSLSLEQVQALYQNQTELIVSQETNGGENWTGCITPNDGTEDGTEVCSEGLVLNNLEVINVNITSEDGTNYTSENLTINYTLQNGSTKGIIDWRLNDTSIALVNMPFEDNNNTNSGTKDYSQFGNDATNNGATWISTGGYDGKGAYEFDGSDDWIKTTNNIGISGSQPRTTMAWVKTKTTTREGIVGFGSGAGNSAFDIEHSVITGGCGAGKLYFVGYGADLCTTFTINDDNWHHVVATYDGTTLNLYGDGTFIDSTSLSLTTSASVLSIGRQSYDDSGDYHYFTGSIDEVKVFNRTLTPEQIQNLYNNRTDLISFNETSVDDNWSACVTPNDGTEDGAEVCSENLTIIAVSNNAPNTTSVIFNATDNPNNYTTANLTCWANITDADADTVYANYTIYHNDTVNITGQSASFTENTLYNIVNISSVNTTKDDNWTCEVQAYDGTDYESDWNNATQLVIQNSPPDQATPTINTTDGNNYTSENITVYNVSTADNDSDSIKNLFDWRINGSSLALLNMPFEGGSTSGTTTPTNGTTQDYSQFSNNGTAVGNSSNAGPQWNATGGYDGKGAYEFGTDDYINIDSMVTDIQDNTEGTIVLWQKINDNTANANSWVGITDGGDAESFMLFKVYGVDVAGRIYFNLFEAGSNLLSFYTDTGVISNDEWYQVAVTMSNTGAKLYLNGVQHTDLTYEAGSSSTQEWFNSINDIDSVRIGGTRGSDAEVTTFDGIIDEVLIFNHSLSSDQIQALYENRTDLIVSQETNGEDNWSACITPNDGTDDGAEVCSTGLTPINPAVINVNVTSESATNYTTENLTVNYTLQNGSTRGIIDWRLNGSSFAILNMPFEKVNDPVINATKDYSQFGEDGSEQGGVLWNATGGHNGFGAYEFDGSDDYITVPSTTFGVIDEVTVSTWVKFNQLDTAKYRPIIAKSTGSVNNRIFLYTDKDTDVLVFLFAGASSQVANIYAFSNLETNVWYHLVGTYNGSTAKLYVNGTEVDSDDGSVGSCNSVGNPLYVGRSAQAWDASWAPHDGTIDEVLIFNRTLTANQILNLYNNRTDLLSFNETSVGDNWSACITPNDGTEDGAEVCSANLIVLEQGLPQVSNMVINTSGGNNYTSENITLYYDITDADNEDVKNITNWKVDGTPLTNLHMPFEKVSDSVINATKDYSGYDNNGSEGAGVLFNATGGYDGFGAFEFDGSDDRISIPHDASQDIQEQLTVSLWAKRTGNCANNCWMVIKQQAASGGVGNLRYGLVIIAATDLPTLSFNTGTWADVVSTDSAIADDVWYMITGTYDGTNAKIYINGVLNNTVAKTGNILASTAGTVEIGRETAAAAEYYKGTLDDILIFNRTLTDDQILALYQNKTDLISSDETNGGENWTGCITPNDGTEDGAEVCSDLILNNLEAANVNITSSSETNYTSENLTVNYTLQNGSTKGIINWKKDSSPIAVLNMPFEKVHDDVINATKDYSGNDLNGSEIAGPTWNATGGYDGKGAFEFDGSSNLILIPDDALLDFTDKFTLMAWIKPDTIQEWEGIISKGYSSINAYALLLSESNTMKYCTGTTCQACGACTLSTGVWQHVAVTFDSGIIRHYVDGALIETDMGATTPTSNNDPLQIGADLYGGDEYFDGTIDGVMVFNRSLSTDQINAIYENRTDLVSSDETNGGENWSACITPNDGTEDGTEVCSENLTVLEANTAPNTTSVIFNATDNPNNRTNANLTCWANITDSNGGDVYANYTIYHNDTINITGQSDAFTENTLFNIVNISSENTTKDENWTCEVIAYDGTDYETDYLNSSQLIIQNSPPTQATPTINTTDGNNYTSENITVYNVSTADNDSDSIKNIFDWKLNGTSIAVLNMPFEDNNNTNSGTKDYSQFGNNGTVSGATWNATSGYDGKGAYEFDGSSDNIQISDSSSIDLTNELTITAWVNPKSYNAWDRIVAKHWATDADPYTIYSLILSDDNDGLEGSIFTVTIGGVDYSVEAVNSVPLNNWTHLVGTYDGNQISLYVNGVLVNNVTQAGTLNTNDKPIFIGKSPWHTVSSFHGTIDEVQIFNHSLTPEQILNIYNNRTDLISSDETNGGENWSACITPNDGTEDGTELCSINLTIGNNLPNTAQVIINATDNPLNQTEANLTCYTNITDVDADQVYANYSLYLNETINTTGQAGPFTQNTLNLIYSLDSANTTKNQNWTCEVVAYDGVGYETDYNNDTITIQNGVPAIELNSPADNDRDNVNLSVNITVTDDDQDVLEVTLYINDTINATNSSATNGDVIIDGTGMGDGLYNWTIQVCDDEACDNQSTRNYTIDTINPIIDWNFPNTNNRTTINTNSITWDTSCRDPNMYEMLMNVTNSSGDSLFSHFETELTGTWHNVTNTTDISTWADGNYTIEMSCSDDHTHGDLEGLQVSISEGKEKTPSVRTTGNLIPTGTLKRGRKGETFLVFNETDNMYLHLEAYFEKKNGQPDSLPGDFVSYFVVGDSDVKFGYNFTMVRKDAYLVLNLTSQEKIIYRSPVTGIPGHFIWGNYYTDFADVPESMDVDITKVSDTNYLIKISGNSTSWNKNDLIEIDPVTGGLNIVTEYKNLRIDRTNLSFTNANNTSTASFKRYSNFTANITLADTSLDDYIFSTNVTGTWANDTPADMAEVKEYNASTTKNISLAQGNQICWYYWANDTAGNNNQSTEYCFDVANTQPNAPNATITPATPTTTDDLTCTIITNSTDIDDDIVNYTFVWYKDDVFNFSSALNDNSTNLLESENTTKDQIWNCTVVPYDGQNNGTNFTTSITVLNTAPVASAINITSDDSQNRTNGSLTGVYTYTDADGDLEGDTETEWYNNSNKIDSLDNFTTINFSNTSKAESWIFSIRVNDGTDWSSWANSSTFTIQNTAPNFTQDLTNQNANSGTAMNLDINCSDVDSDTITYYDNITLFNINSNNGYINDTPTQAEAGTYNINISCGDSTINTSQTFTYTIADATNPTFSNDLNISTNDFKRYSNFTANITIDNTALDDYIFSTDVTGTWANDTSVDMAGAAQYNASTTKNISLAQGNQICWYYWVNDTSSNNASSTEQCFIVANTAPTTPILDEPNNNTNTTDNTPTFNWTNSTDNDNDAITYEILIDDETNFNSPYTQSNSTLTETNFTATTLSDGTYYWKVKAITPETNSSYTDYNILLVETESPNIQLIGPTNNLGDTSGNITIQYNVTDDSTVSNCSLIVNSGINQTDTTITNNATQSFALDNLTQGQYNWSINCTDPDSNDGFSNTRTFVIFNTSEFNGESTSLNGTDISNITNLIIDQADYGLINFSEVVDLSDGADIDSYVNISYNLINIDSDSLPSLNKSATLYLYNLSFTNPRILRNDEICTSTICTEISYFGGNLTFNVTQFTNYSAEETPTTTSTPTTSGGGGGSSPTTAAVTTPEKTPDTKPATEKPKEKPVEKPKTEPTEHKKEEKKKPTPKPSRALAGRAIAFAGIFSDYTTLWIIFVISLAILLLIYFIYRKFRKRLVKPVPRKTWIRKGKARIQVTRAPYEHTTTYYLKKYSSLISKKIKTAFLTLGHILKKIILFPIWLIITTIFTIGRAIKKAFWGIGFVIRALFVGLGMIIKATFRAIRRFFRAIGRAIINSILWVAETLHLVKKHTKRIHRKYHYRTEKNLHLLTENINDTAKDTHKSFKEILFTIGRAIKTAIFAIGRGIKKAFWGIGFVIRALFVGLGMIIKATYRIIKKAIFAVGRAIINSILWVAETLHLVKKHTKRIHRKYHYRTEKNLHLLTENINDTAKDTHKGFKEILFIIGRAIKTAIFTIGRAIKKTFWGIGFVIKALALGLNIIFKAIVKATKTTILFIARKISQLYLAIKEILRKRKNRIKQRERRKVERKRKAFADQKRKESWARIKNLREQIRSGFDEGYPTRLLEKILTKKGWEKETLSSNLKKLTEKLENKRLAEVATIKKLKAKRKKSLDDSLDYVESELGRVGKTDLKKKRQLWNWWAKKDKTKQVEPKKKKEFVKKETPAEKRWKKELNEKLTTIGTELNLSNKYKDYLARRKHGIKKQPTTLPKIIKRKTPLKQSKKPTINKYDKKLTSIEKELELTQNQNYLLQRKYGRRKPIEIKIKKRKREEFESARKSQRIKKSLQKKLENINQELTSINEPSNLTTNKNIVEPKKKRIKKIKHKRFKFKESKIEIKLKDKLKKQFKILGKELTKTNKEKNYLFKKKYGKTKKPKPESELPIPKKPVPEEELKQTRQQKKLAKDLKKIEEKLKGLKN